MADALIEACSPGIFSPSVFGAEILDTYASVVSDYFPPVTPDTPLQSFCNVTVTYTHPGQNDYIIVEAWLPIDDYNGRFQAVGGGAWSPGRSASAWNLMAESIVGGFATITTDAGLVGNDGTATPWALLSPGNVDLFSLQNLASVSLNDEAIIGKSLIKAFYGQGPEYSYFYGCSQGGRQGLMLAQRYPDAYDGIAAYAPAIHWNPTLASVHWPYQVMLNLGVFPDACEFDALRAAAVSFCDDMDGVTDGVITNVDECIASFDPFTLVGKPAQCGNSTIGGPVKITEAAAIVLNETWHGLKTEDGRRYWYGFMPGADLTGNDPRSLGLWGPIMNECSSNGTCVEIANPLSIPWFQDFLIKRPDTDLSQVTHAEFDRLVHSGNQYQSIIGTDDPDLSAFRKAGGKLTTIHGLVSALRSLYILIWLIFSRQDDALISPKGSEAYYNAVTELDSQVHDFYRYYEVPGLGHCGAGASSLPLSLLGQLRTWVENGTAPESTPVEVTLPGGEVHNRILCPYPQRAQLDVCDDPADADCWSCGGHMDEL